VKTNIFRIDAAQAVAGINVVTLYNLFLIFKSKALLKRRCEEK
jgi:hypothetical protein